MLTNDQMIITFYPDSVTQQLKKSMENILINNVCIEKNVW